MMYFTETCVLVYIWYLFTVNDLYKSTMYNHQVNQPLTFSYCKFSSSLLRLQFGTHPPKTVDEKTVKQRSSCAHEANWFFITTLENGNTVTAFMLAGLPAPYIHYLRNNKKRRFLHYRCIFLPLSTQLYLLHRLFLAFAGQQL